MNTKEATDRDCVMASTPKDCCGRQSGRGVINDMIVRLRRRADALEALSNMLPAQPTPQQDEALWSIAIEMERR